MFPEALHACTRWDVSPEGLPLPDPDHDCATRDVFEGRLTRLLTEAVRAGIPEADAALLTAVAGEIGNNSFDHNLGHWQDLATTCRAIQTTGLLDGTGAYPSNPPR